MMWKELRSGTVRLRKAHRLGLMRRDSWLAQTKLTLIGDVRLRKAHRLALLRRDRLRLEPERSLASPTGFEPVF